MSAGATNDGSYDPLAPASPFAEALVEYLRLRTIIGRMTGWRRAPFSVKVPRETATAAVNWVGQGQVCALSQMALDSLSLPFHKAVGVVVLTEELARFSDPSAEDVVRNHLTAALVSFFDSQALDPYLTTSTRGRGRRGVADRVDSFFRRSVCSSFRRSE